ncbi:sperm microtubule associated protein 2 isoform X2 [Oreochromis niloticus]|uniref:sperm microtubule associated protein 2 isoform X2 n=1 Tax=Oreochromis niloticus TaxID=8128 RepID=UPI000DF40711|nr:testicular haploid expressed gene protein isoform X2 [Oreochromis niloticus]
MATRMQQLAQPKPNRLRYPDRRSVYWLDKLPPERSRLTTKIELTPRWSDLCISKKFYNQVSRGIQTAVATSRICQLAQPKRRQVLEKSRHKSKYAQVIHLPSKASAHIELLATPKNDHPEFKGDRPMCWPVSKAAKSSITSQRLLDLSSPKERKALYEGYDPYMISRAARSASPSPRIQQLCLPLSRKCSSE